MKILIITIIVLSGLQSMAQTNNNTVVDPKTGTNILVGYCDKSGLEKGEYGDYFKSNYDDYIPTKSYIKKLGKKLNNVEITIVLGTWCSDSKREVPRYYKILNEVGYDTKHIKLIAVDRNKEAPGIDIRDINIQKVPIFIFYKNSEEIGRIIETPNKSLERDTWKIVK